MTLRMNSSPSQKVTLLVLGAGWTWQFLQPQLKQADITHAATTTTGREGTIQFKFDGETADPEQFRKLPTARYVLVTFPLRGRGLSSKLQQLYSETHPPSRPGEQQQQQQQQQHALTKWIQLGSTGIYTGQDWNDSSSPVDTSNERCVAEDELIELGGCVLNLSGLYGGGRDPRNWVGRVAQTKDALSRKGALHLIHGQDVSRGIVALVKADTDMDTSNDDDDDSSSSSSTTTTTTRLFGRRWIVTDCCVYDWWGLVWEFMGDPSRESAPANVENAVEKAKYRRWLAELMDENKLNALPRPTSQLGKKLDSRDFWKAVGILPEKALAR
ncbi:hypothetical protein PV08_09644 [Exophiala spinifera]|uniref:NAD(P)-binding domain-containing protein n=1 Tax=Exophiala spinifera TaxID=91928 RepID=A0A0D1ZHG2_9EURO|nr:uncharacterized protein PV08_09644 [Exophiala spinifera]KIW12367.1 hypothetical protein PV08_09644 [Exophiala spinifera]